MIDPDLYRFDSFKDFGILYEIASDPGQINAVSESLRNIKLTTAVAVEFAFADREIIFIYFLIKYFVFSFTVIIFFKLRKIFTTLETGNPFIPENAGRIRWIGYSIIGISLASIIVGALLLIFLKDPFLISGKQVETYWMSVYMNVADNISSIFWGGLVLLIAEIFRQAVKLKEEQELTV
jgi:hypothetical protein